MTTKVYPRAVRIKIFPMAVDPYHRYSIESERANEDIYDDLKLEKTSLVFMDFTKIIQRFKG